MDPPNNMIFQFFVLSKNNESTQYNAVLAITDAIRGPLKKNYIKSSTMNLSNKETGIEPLQWVLSLISRYLIKNSDNISEIRTKSDSGK